MVNGQIYKFIVDNLKNHPYSHDTLFDYCLEGGGKCVEQAQLKLITDCIQICQIAAEVMAHNSKLHNVLCIACAEACEACANLCRKMADSQQ